MPNVTVINKLFNEEVFDIHFESVHYENRSPYTTTMPNLGPSLGKPKVIKLPRTFVGQRETPYVRAAQPKQKHRETMLSLATDPEHKWPLYAALQSYQGGFMSKASGTRLSDRDRLQTSNPVVYAHGTSSISGQLNFSNIIPKPPVHTSEYPVVRTDSTEQQAYHIKDEDTLRVWEKLRKDRAPYSKARLTAKMPALDTLLQNLKDDRREEEVTELEKFIATKPNDKVIRTWLEGKNEEFKRNLTKSGAANVELRQALPGYEVVVPGTLWEHDVRGWNMPMYIAGLTTLAFNARMPTLGGHAAAGCGFHPRVVFRVAVAQSQRMAKFDCLLKIEPFRGMSIALQDVTGDWDFLQTQQWHPVETGDGPDCFVNRAIKAWFAYDQTKLDFDFVPRTVASAEPEIEYDEAAE